MHGQPPNSRYMEPRLARLLDKLGSQHAAIFAKQLYYHWYNGFFKDPAKNIRKSDSGVQGFPSP